MLSGDNIRHAAYSALHSKELTRWNEDAAAVIAVYNGLNLEVYPRQQGTGATKKSRHIRFLEKLTPYTNGQTPTLKFKTRSPRLDVRISLEITRFKNDPSLVASARQKEFTTKVTRASTLVISAKSPIFSDVNINMPVSEQIRAIEAAAEAAQELIEWWEDQFT